MSDIHFSKNTELPMGLGMALAQNMKALNRFSEMSEEERQKVINRTHQIHSKDEMRQLTERIAEGTFPF